MLISHIVQLLLIRKFNCFPKGQLVLCLSFYIQKTYNYLPLSSFCPAQYLAIPIACFFIFGSLLDYEKIYL